jgi:SAM-dependent methyltransferase
MHSAPCYRLSIHYDSDYGHHRDELFVQQENLPAVSAKLPAAMRNDVLASDDTCSDKGTRTFDYIKGKLFSNDLAAQVISIPEQSFVCSPGNNIKLEPRIGRFYPAALFNSEKLPTSNRMTPFRIIERRNGELLVNTSHPLSDYDITLTVESIKPQDAIYEACDNTSRSLQAGLLPDFLTGPGMQLRHHNISTDFFSDNPFQRADNTVDSEFYSQPRLIEHLDAYALLQLKSLHNRLLTPGSRVLDMMSSINSHLDQNLLLKKLTGLGMNREELEANPRLDEIIVHDINQQHRLPFDDASFDVVLCSLSIEYLTRPSVVFDEVTRIIRPGGRFIISFSNRWFPPKAVQLWSNLHDFERIGLVTEYFIESAGFGVINTVSIRGLPRPANDRHRLALSDPLYAVWADRA